jgi:hypothetical protein
MHIRLAAFSLLLVCLAVGCDDAKRRRDGGTMDADIIDAGGNLDASIVDGGADIDGGEDGGAPDAQRPLPAHEIISGAAHVRGAGFAADVQIGHGIDQRPAGGADHSIEGNAAVKP